jgi:predicted lysophospholipase L1 biosynthesis ABC-type transport system permease subunit
VSLEATTAAALGLNIGDTVTFGPVRPVLQA